MEKQNIENYFAGSIAAALCVTKLAATAIMNPQLKKEDRAPAIATTLTTKVGTSKMLDTIISVNMISSLHVIADSIISKQIAMTLVFRKLMAEGFKYDVDMYLKSLPKNPVVAPITSALIPLTPTATPTATPVATPTSPDWNTLLTLDPYTKKVMNNKNFLDSPMIASNFIYHEVLDTDADLVISDDYCLARVIPTAVISDFTYGSLLARDVVMVTHYDPLYPLIATMLHSIMHNFLYCLNTENATRANINRILNASISVANEFLSKNSNREYMTTLAESFNAAVLGINVNDENEHSGNTLTNTPINDQLEQATFADILETMKTNKRHPLKTLRCVVFAIREYARLLPNKDAFSIVITRIILAGGDSCTAACIVAACLGCIIGMDELVAAESTKKWMMLLTSENKKDIRVYGGRCFTKSV
jgi:hypothetical protein